MKLLHTSDWHIGRQFHNVSLLDDQSYVLDQLIGYIKDEQVDVVVVAGDIYDRSVPPARAVELLDRVLHSICHDLQVPVVLIPGNHDGAERLRFGARQLRGAGLHILADLRRVAEPITITAASGVSANFYGIPYSDPEQVRGLFDVTVSTHDEAHSFLVGQIKQVLDSDEVNVLISHCFVDGAEASESERPLAIGGVDYVSAEPLALFDYVALGHLHSPQRRGGEHIRYSGSLLKYSFSEQHQRKGVTLVTMDGRGAPTITTLPLRPIRDMRVVEGALADIIEQGRSDPHADDYLLVRLNDPHAILDAMGKLRTVYPNVLHLEKPGIMAVGEKRAMRRDQLQRSELDMFRDFYAQASGNPLTVEQDHAIEVVIEALHRAEAER